MRNAIENSHFFCLSVFIFNVSVFNLKKKKKVWCCICYLKLLSLYLIKLDTVSFEFYCAIGNHRCHSLGAIYHLLSCLHGYVMLKLLIFLDFLNLFLCSSNVNSSWKWTPELCILVLSLFVALQRCLWPIVPVAFHSEWTTWCLGKCLMENFFKKNTSGHTEVAL